MKPRVDIVGVPLSATASDILQIVVENRYSRIPVYRGDVDNVVGIVYSKDLLDAFSRTLANEERPIEAESGGGAALGSGLPGSGSGATVNWGELTAERIMEPTYFIPETMTAWSALQVRFVLARLEMPPLALWVLISRHTNPLLHDRVAGPFLARLCVLSLPKPLSKSLSKLPI